MQLPEGYIKMSNEMVNRRIMTQLFRTMATHEDIFSRMGEKLCCTNLYVALRKGTCCKENDNIPQYMSIRPQFKYPPVNKRCKMTTFNFSHDMEPLVSVEETPAKTRKISGARDIYNTPQPLEMC